jgi:hypothetical protein
MSDLQKPTKKGYVCYGPVFGQSGTAFAWIIGSKVGYLICLEVGTIQRKLPSSCCPAGYLYIFKYANS